MNRVIDILFAFAVLILTLPITLIAILSILILDFGHPFFRHERVGRSGKTFRLFKFRTMKTDTDYTRGITVAGDLRITRIGKVLRRLKIDELPQLINVLIGDMAIVGPRPETREFVALYDDDQRQILKYRPGLTDPSSIKYRYEEKILARYADPVKAYKETVMPAKIAISLDYQKSRTFLSDVGVIAKTIVAIFRSPGSMDDEL